MCPATGNPDDSASDESAVAASSPATEGFPLAVDPRESGEAMFTWTPQGLPEEAFRRIVETTLEGIWAMDAGQRTTYVNHRMAEMLGCRPQDMLGRPVSDFMFPEDLPAHRQRMTERRSGHTGRYEQKFRRADGEAVWCLVCANPLMSRDGQFAGSFAVFTDITDRRRAEQALAAERANLQAVFECAPIGMALIADDCRIRLANTALARAFGLDPRAPAGLRCGDLLGCVHAREHPDGCGFSPSCPACRIMRAIRAGLEAGQAELGAETRVRLLRDGVEHRPWLRFSVQPLALEGRRHVVMTVEDISDRRHAEESLRRTEQNLRAILNATTSAVVMLDREGIVLETNDAHAARLGLTRERLLGRRVFDFFEPEVARRRIAALQASLDSGCPIRFEDERAGRWNDVVIWPIPDEQGRFTRAAVHAADITDRRRAEQAAALEERRLEALLALAEMTDEPEKRLADFTLDRAVELTGSTMGFLGFVSEDQATMFIHAWSAEAMSQCAIPEKPLQFAVSEAGLWGEAVRRRRPILVNDYASCKEFRRGCPHGHVAIRRFLGVPVLEQDRVRVVVAVANRQDEYGERDVRQLSLLAGGMWRQIQRRRTEAKLRESEALYRTVVEAAGDAILVADAHTGILLGANRRAEELLGRPRQRIIGLHQSEIHPPEDAHAYRNLFRQAVAEPGRQFHEVCVLRADGTRVPVEVSSGGVVRAGGRDIHLGIFRDITARRRMEAALRESEERLRLAQRATNDVIWDWDVVADLQRWNESGAVVFGWTDIVEAPQTADWWVQRVHPDDRRRVEEGFFAVVRDPARDRWSDEYRFRRADGSYAEVIDRGYVLRDAEGRAVRMIGAMLDVTQRKRAEQERMRMQERLGEVQKLEAMGQLAAGVAHDFNNLLSVIRLSGEMVLAVPELPDAARDTLEAAQLAASQAMDITRSLLTFGREIPVRPTRIDLRRVIDDAVRLLAHALPRTISLTVSCDSPGELPVLADPTQISQVIFNLVLNARDAMPDGGTIRIDAAAADPSAEAACAASVPRNGSWVRLAVSDTGVGIPAEVRPRLFEPFFTTKPRGQGTGLGLCVVHGIIRKHGGLIEVMSEVGQGTTFAVFLPRAAAEEPARPSEAGSDRAVLLAAEDSYFRGMIASVLRSCGHTVLAAGDLTEAAGLLRENGSRVGLLLLDEGLADGSADVQLRSLRGDDEEPPAVILATRPPEQVPPAPNTVVLPPRFQMSELIEAVRRRLAGQPRTEEPA